jgi:hypothetical protein
MGNRKSIKCRCATTFQREREREREREEIKNETATILSIYHLPSSSKITNESFVAFLRTFAVSESSIMNVL